MKHFLSIMSFVAIVKYFTRENDDLGYLILAGILGVMARLEFLEDNLKKKK